MNPIKELLYRLRGEYTTEKLISMGMTVGTNFKRLHGVILDPAHCWLITIGDNVTMAPRVHILCHDASTKQFLNYTKIGNVTIGDNVFIGAKSVVLPGVTFAEKYGTMINVAGRIQRLNKAIEPIGDSMSDWEICRNLSERLGCDCVRVIACPTPMSVLDEMAQEFEPLEGITWGNIGNEGKVIMDTGVTIPLIEREKAKK